MTTKIDSSTSLKTEPVDRLFFAAMLGTFLGSVGLGTPRLDLPRDLAISSAPLLPIAAQRKSAVLNGLKWLARHQFEDGSWGRCKEGCPCPQGGMEVPPIKVRDAEVEKKARPLIEALDGDDPFDRDQASAALKALGEKVEPFLEDALRSEALERRSRAGDLFFQLRRLREPEPPVGITACALDAFLGAGYSHLSRDVYDGLDFGAVVKKAIRWLLGRQSADGAIGKADRDDALLQHSWATLALSEAYGMTASQSLKGPVQKAVSYLVSRQSDDGGWHRKGPTPVGDVLPTIVAGLALMSAELSEVEIDAVRLERARESIDRLLGPNGLSGMPPSRATVGGAMLVSLLADKKKAKANPRVERAAEWLSARKPESDAPDFLGWNLASMALFSFSGPDGAAWRGWNGPLKEALVPVQRTGGCLDGSWNPEGAPPGLEGGRMSATALAVVTLEIMYRYANVLSSH